MVVVDMHAHGLGMLPAPFSQLYRLGTFGRMPPDRSLDVVHAADVDLLVACAVGDGVVTRWNRGTPWQAVVRQLGDLRAQAADAELRIAASPLDLDADEPAIVLGLEGADALDGDVDRVDELHALGVRVAGLVHFADNCCGTCCMPWQRWSPVPLPLGRPEEGLTTFGKRVMARMTELGMVVDVAHADRATTLDMCEHATAPVINSHTGSAAFGDFERFISDDEARAIAATGGLVGLWPFRFGKRGIADVDDWIRHAGHFAEMVGVEHLCLGTDQNGVSGLMEGYRGLHDLPVLATALARAGFSADEVERIMGGNAARVLRSVLR